MLNQRPIPTCRANAKVSVLLVVVNPGLFCMTIFCAASRWCKSNDCQLQQSFSKTKQASVSAGSAKGRGTHQEKGSNVRSLQPWEDERQECNIWLWKGKKTGWLADMGSWWNLKETLPWTQHFQPRRRKASKMFVQNRPTSQTSRFLSRASFVMTMVCMWEPKLRSSTLFKAVLGCGTVC